MEPHIFGKGFLAVRIVKAALVAAIAIVALVVFLSRFSGGERQSCTDYFDRRSDRTCVASYVKDALARAGERRAEIVILRLNTPGSLNTSMREIIADVLASPVPVIGYVAPSEAHAASAGTYILYATHIAAMAPGTNIGAATPVQIGGPIPGLPSGTPDKESKDKKDGDRQAEPKDAMTAKVTNDAVAFIRSLAELRGRNADWAEKAVREAATLTANAALQAKVIDLIARDPAELLSRSMVAWWRLQGARHNTWQPRMPSSSLSIPDGPRDSWRPSPILTSRLFQSWHLRPDLRIHISRRDRAGVVGTICLLLGLYALNVLPIDYAGSR